jgi:CRISPR-associated protein Csh2
MNEENLVKNRSEIVFLYDIKDANPNGDPMDENKPRIDEETGINIVTDVRLKRTIRDYLHNFKGKEIFVREIEYEPGKIQDAKLRIEDFLKDAKGTKIKKTDLNLGQMKDIMGKNVKSDCVDVRLFGATIPVEKSAKEKSSITLIGPVQFRFGRSLHRVDVVHIKGTGAFASGKDMEQKTFREEYILPYSLISFYGILNENAAKTTGLTKEDVNLLLDGLWNGTKNLITRSKIGQVPRLLLNVVYKENNFHVGDLDKKLNLETVDGKSERGIRDISEIKLNAVKLINALGGNKDKIERVELKADDEVVFLLPEDKEGDKKELVNSLREKGIQVQELSL